MHVDRDLGHEVAEDAVDGLHAFGLDLDVVAVHVEVDLVRPDVELIAVGIGLGHDQHVQLFQERLQLAGGEVADEPQAGLLGRLLVAVLGGGQQDRRLGPVERRGVAAPFSLIGRRKMSLAP